MLGATIALIALTLLSPPEAEAAPDGACDPEEGPRYRWTPEQRAETRRRVGAVCRALGASSDACAALDVVTMRESSGAASRRHTLGADEFGLGPHGLSVRYHAPKWDRTDPEALCRPEISAILVLEIWHRALSRYHGQTWADLQAVFAGRFYFVRDWPGHNGAYPARSERGDRAWCDRLAARGIDCWAPVTHRELGRRLRTRAERRNFIDSIVRVAVETGGAP